MTTFAAIWLLSTPFWFVIAYLLFKTEAAASMAWFAVGLGLVYLAVGLVLYF